MKRKIDVLAGIEALKTCELNAGLTNKNCSLGVEPIDLKTGKQTVATAIRFSLEEIATRESGKAVEIRVPPYGAVQAFEGATHRRGTPTSVIETNPETWLKLVLGELNLEECIKNGSVSASGPFVEKLAKYLPLSYKE
jgi:hypothetical protein